MAKTIKFNLICDGKPVRTIVDLQNNFSIEDVLEYYNNKLLHRWLDVRNYKSELDEVSAITSSDEIEIIKELIRIFDVSADEEKVEESIYMLRYQKEREKRRAAYKQESVAVTKIIDGYKEGYCRLVDSILANPDDVAVIKANIAEIVSHYSWILKLNHRNLFYILKNKSALAVMCLLMNENTRNYYLPVEVTQEDGTVIKDIEINADKREMYRMICSIVGTSKFMEALGKNLRVFSGETDSYWKDLEPAGKQYMIISMGNGDNVRPAGQKGCELTSEDIVHKFVLLNGIDYRSNSYTRKLRYMEV